MVTNGCQQVALSSFDNTNLIFETTTNISFMSYFYQIYLLKNNDRYTRHAMILDINTVELLSKRLITTLYHFLPHRVAGVALADGDEPAEGLLPGESGAEAVHRDPGRRAQRAAQGARAGRGHQHRRLHPRHLYAGHHRADSTASGEDQRDHCELAQ